MKIRTSYIALLIIATFLSVVYYIKLEVSQYKRIEKDRKMHERHLLRNGYSHAFEVDENLEKSDEYKPLLTIFTTFKEIKPIPHHEFARNIVTTNWPLFKPYIRPVAFLNFTDSDLASKARSEGWDVLPTVRVNNAGTPFLKDMFKSVFDRYDSMLYGFANGDILFDESIVQTLKAVQRNIDVLKNNVLVTGRRTNIDLPVILNGSLPFDDFRVDNLRKVAEANGTLIPDYAVDYFFFTKDGCSLNWSSLVDVVIGRPAYDTYLVGSALQQEVNVIDTTKTLLAIHISVKGILSTGRQNIDAGYNSRLIGNFPHGRGYPSSARLATTTDISGRIFVMRRR